MTRCGENVTFTCNAVLDSDDGTIAWFRNGTTIFTKTYRTSDSYPQHDTTMFGSLVTMENVFRMDGKFHFVNFTLTNTLQFLQDYTGQQLACGQVLAMSSPVEIEDYSITGIFIH